jgi:hypothetical protein
MSVAEIAGRVTVSGVAVAALVVHGVILARAAPYIFGRPFGLSATSVGIDAQTEWGSRIHMTWDEMRLLEVVKRDRQAQRRFALYAPGKRIDWAKYAMGLGGQYAPVGATTSERALRQAALLSLIAARTGLAPRTLAKTLERKPASAREVKRSSNAAALLVFALILGGITAADYFVPLTPVSWVNWLSTSSLALLTGCLLVASLWTALVRNTLPAHAAPPTAGAFVRCSWRCVCLELENASALAARTGTHRRVPRRQPGARRLDAAPLVRPLSARYHPQALSDGAFASMGRYLLAFALCTCGVIGLGLIYGGAMATTTDIRADKNGLTIGSGRRQRLMPWSSVRDISWGVGGRRPFPYVVTSDTPTLSISWPAGSQGAQSVHQPMALCPLGEMSWRH